MCTFASSVCHKRRHYRKQKGMDAATPQQAIWRWVPNTNKRFILATILSLAICYSQSHNRDFVLATHWNNVTRTPKIPILSIVTNDNNPEIHTTWLQSRKQLCPKGIPNLTHTSSLFSLASKMLLDNMPLPNEQPTYSKSMVSQFYHGFFDDLESMSIYVDSNVTLVYVRIYKCGNNFIRAWERKEFGTGVKGSDVATTLNNKNTTWQQGVFYSGVNIQQAMSILSQAQHKPCIVTAIRDPISHFLSAYNEIEWRTWAQIHHPKSKTPPYFLELNYTTEQERQERFSQFVFDVIHGTWDQFKGIGRLHFTSMSRVKSAMKRHGLELSAYLPTLNNLSTAWPTFVDSACSEMQSSFSDTIRVGHMQAVVGSHESSEDKVGFYRAARSVWENEGAVAEALCVIHAMDYACWENLPDGIPEICQRVFEDPMFVNTIV